MKNKSGDPEYQKGFEEGVIAGKVQSGWFTMIDDLKIRLEIYNLISDMTSERRKYWLNKIKDSIEE